MESLKARSDGKCTACKTAFAAMVGGVLCKKCLRAAVEHDNPIVRDLSRRGTEEIGRPARDMKVVGGAPF